MNIKWFLSYASITVVVGMNLPVPHPAAGLSRSHGAAVRSEPDPARATSKAASPTNTKHNIANAASRATRIPANLAYSNLHRRFGSPSSMVVPRLTIDKRPFRVPTRPLIRRSGCGSRVAPSIV